LWGGDHHDYQLYLAINDIDFAGGLQKILNEFYQIAFRKKLYADMEELQKDLNELIKVKCVADEPR